MELYGAVGPSAPDDGGPLWAATPAAGNDGFIGVDIKGVRKWRFVGSGRNAGLQPEAELVGLKVLNPRSPASLAPRAPFSPAG